MSVDKTLVSGSMTMLLLKLLEEKGYRYQRGEAVDLFPRTKHVECVIVLSKGTGTASI